MSTIKRRVRRSVGRTIQSIGHATGIMPMPLGFARPEGAVILMYHSVADDTLHDWIDPANHVPADVFRRQMKFLAENRNVLTMEEIVAMLRIGASPPADTVGITFDDGYLDNLTVAAPILDSFGLTATLFLPTGYIDRTENQWIDETYSAFSFRSARTLSWGYPLPRVFNLEDRRNYRNAYDAVCRDLLTASYEKRRRLLTALIERLEPSAYPPRLTMSWKDVQTLLTKHDCFEIGSHTLDHTDLTAIDEAEVGRELESSAERIVQQTGTRPRHFSFCYGRTSESLRRLVAETGYEAACGGGELAPVITAPLDVFRLPRVTAPRSMNRFRVITTSANTGFWRRLG